MRIYSNYQNDQNNKFSGEKQFERKLTSNKEAYSRILKTDPKQALKKRIRSTRDLTQSFESNTFKNTLGKSQPKFLEISQNYHQTGLDHKYRIKSSANPQIVTNRRKNIDSFGPTTQRAESESKSFLKASDLQKLDLDRFHQRMAEDVQSRSTHKQKLKQKATNSISRFHKLTEIERKSIVKKSEILKEIVKAKNKHSTYCHHTIGDCEHRLDLSNPHFPEEEFIKNKIKEEEENIALLEANKLVSAQVDKYNKKLRYLTLKKTKKRRSRRLHRSKMEEQKRSQILKDASKEYESIYLLDDFKSYNKSCEDMEMKYKTNSTLEQKIPVKIHNSRNKIQGAIDKKHSSKFKLTTNSIKHQELQDYLKDSSFVQNSPDIGDNESGL